MGANFIDKMKSFEKSPCSEYSEDQSSLIAGLDCGLDHLTGLLDWITEQTFELKLRVSHDLHPIGCAELGHMFDASD